MTMVVNENRQINKTPQEYAIVFFFTDLCRDSNAMTSPGLRRGPLRLRQRCLNSPYQTKIKHRVIITHFCHFIINVTLSVHHR